MPPTPSAGPVLPHGLESGQRLTIVVPVLNQLRYTQMCLDSLSRAGVPRGAILVIDNASTDETGDWLAGAGYPYVRNRVNLGCGGAWAQGALLSDSEWVMFLNNDVKVCERFCERLLDRADALGLDVVSPAMIENELDYEFDAFAADYLQRMGEVVRRDVAHGVCFAARRATLESVGFPDTDRRLGGHEDVEFFLRCQALGKTVATVGSAVLHHFGSITQKALKAESGAKSLGDRKVFYAKAGMGWLARKRWKRERQRRVRENAARELAAGGLTLHMIRQGGSWIHI